MLLLFMVIILLRCWMVRKTYKFDRGLVIAKWQWVKSVGGSGGKYLFRYLYNCTDIEIV